MVMKQVSARGCPDRAAGPHVDASPPQEVRHQDDRAAAALAINLPYRRLIMPQQVGSLEEEAPLLCAAPYLQPLCWLDDAA